MSMSGDPALTPGSAFQDTASSQEEMSGRNLILCNSNQQSMEVTPTFHGRASPLHKSTGSFSDVNLDTTRDISPPFQGPDRGRFVVSGDFDGPR